MRLAVTEAEIRSQEPEVRRLKKEKNMKTALVLVDIQNDYFPGGPMELEGSVQASLLARELLSAFRQRGLPLVHVQHLSTRPGATFFLPNTEGVKIHEHVQPFDHEVIIQKHYPNSFRDTQLLTYLHAEQIKALVICGMMTHMCVDATTRAAFDYGFECLVAEDACATKTLLHRGQTIPALHVHLSFMAALNAVYAKVLNTEEIISLLPDKTCLT
jgi:nicotinamidase-related amidase